MPACNCITLSDRVRKVQSKDRNISSSYRQLTLQSRVYNFFFNFVHASKLSETLLYFRS